MIYPVLLCGGSGTRLWPLSRKSFPKQFNPILGDQSLFQASALRFQDARFGAPVIITADPFRFIVTEQLDEIGVKPSSIMIEPEGRNTAPAALVAALHIARKDPAALMLLAPSDHVVSDPRAFEQTILKGAEAATAGQIVTFGIAPTRAETGYGWLETGEPDGQGVMPLARFIEKPDQAGAEALLENAACLWNSGLFLTSVGTLIEAFKTLQPEMFAAVEAAEAKARPDLSFLRIDEEAWAKVPEDSIDYAIMEQSKNLSAVRFDGHWSDLGSWEAVWQETPHDVDDNALSENATAIACRGSLLRSESDAVELVGVGLENTVAIATRDAVLVADLSTSQNVKLAVQELKSRNVPQAETFPKDHRPWGWFETLVLSDRFQVKRIHVNPGQALSLQSHVHRSEHWIVVAGTAKVTVDDEIKLLGENESVYIPLGAIHRLENPGKVPMVLIEVQTGSYLGEDDIVRYEDVYARD